MHINETRTDHRTFRHIDDGCIALGLGSVTNAGNASGFDQHVDALVKLVDGIDDSSPSE
jgi:hypothetical protein